MITFFNRKRILTSSSMEDLGRFKMILSQNKIPFIVRTIRARGSIGTALDARSYQQFNLAYTDAKTASFVYYVYVHRRDEGRARTLV
jgi:hypothetical protein